MPLFSFQAPLLAKEMMPIASHMTCSIATLICILLFIGAMGKSAKCLCMCGYLIQWKALHLFQP